MSNTSRSLPSLVYDRAMYIHCARVYLAESRKRQHQRAFSFTLLDWAGNARRRAAAQPRDAMQTDLFSGAA